MPLTLSDPLLSASFGTDMSGFQNLIFVVWLIFVFVLSAGLDVSVSVLITRCEKYRCWASELSDSR